MKPEYHPRARKNERVILNTIESVGGDQVALRMEVSASTVSRLKNGDMVQFAGFLSCLGLKIVPEHYVCRSLKRDEAMLYFAKIGMGAIESASQLGEEDPE
jgi:hypothetical protein